MEDKCTLCEYNGDQANIDSMCQVCFEGNMFVKKKNCDTCINRFGCSYGMGMRCIQNYHEYYEEA